MQLLIAAIHQKHQKVYKLETIIPFHKIIYLFIIIYQLVNYFLYNINTLLINFIFRCYFKFKIILL